MKKRSINNPFVVKEGIPEVDLSKDHKRIGPETPDEDEAWIVANADEFTAYRFRGRGRYDNLGPFADLDSCLRAIVERCRDDPQDRGFMVYARKREGSRHTHVVNTDRNGAPEESFSRWKKRREEEKWRAKKRSPLPRTRS